MSLRILVVENIQKNITAAKAMLADHELTIAEDYDHAHSLLGQILSPFDVVLTDVMFPKNCDECIMSEAGMRPACKQPYGPIVALHALSVGVKKVGIITQGNHYNDTFSCTFDHLDGFTAGDVKVIICGDEPSMEVFFDLIRYTPIDRNYADPNQRQHFIAGNLAWVKNWAKLLDQLLS